jgi:hypothetical protein
MRNLLAYVNVILNILQECIVREKFEKPSDLFLGWNPNRLSLFLSFLHTH